MHMLLRFHSSVMTATPTFVFSSLRMENVSNVIRISVWAQKRFIKSLQFQQPHGRITGLRVHAVPSVVLSAADVTL